MLFRPNLKNKIAAILFAILPAFIVGSLVFGANVYYDLDSTTVKTNEHAEIVGNLTVSGTGNILFSTSGTINQTGVGQVTFAGNVDASNGLDVTGALTSTGNTTLATGSSTTNTFGSGASSINTIGSVTTPGALTLHGATSLDNTFNLTYSGASTALTVTQSSTGSIVSLVGDSITSGTGLALSVDGLVDGKGFSITSTSTALTSGKLFSLDWSPGSATTSTGDLFNINIGANGTAGNLFNITDNGSSLFSVSESAITSSLPHSFTSAGDVLMAYDLLFTNQSASYIKSNAPLYLEAGESFESNDLTLKTYNQGTIVVDSAATIGTSMSISSGSLTTGTGLALTADSLTTGTGLALSVDGLTIGTGVDISSTSTAGTGSAVSKLLNLSRSGANTNASHTAYGLYSSVTDTGTTSTNIGGYFTASGATNNYGLIVASGNVGVGTTSPTAYLELKAGTTVAGTAPLKFTAGTNLTAAEAGAMEWDGSLLYITQTTGPTRKTIAYTSDITAAAHDPITIGAVGSVPNANGMTLTGQLLNLEPADATNPGAVTTGSQIFAGAKTFNDLITGNAGLTVTGAAANLNASSNFATNVNTGTSTGAVTVGGGSNTVEINSSGWAIGTTGDMTGIGGITMDGSFSQTGTGTFSTGSGAVSLNGNTTITGDLKSSGGILYDAIISSTVSKGQYTSIQAAINDGKKRIFVRNGTYLTTADIVVPDGAVIIGESKEGVIIDFASYDTDTATFTQGSATVAVVDSTGWAAGDYIKNNSVGKYYKILTVDSGIQVTLTENYQEATASSVAATIRMPEAYQILAQGDTGAYITGTLTIANGQRNVTGSGTAWIANAVAGDYILLGQQWYKISSILSDTSLTIEDFYQGLALSGASYRVATFKEKIMIENIQAINSSDAYGAIYLIYTKDSTLKNIITNNNVYGITLSYSYFNNILDNEADNNSNSGILLDYYSDNNTISGNEANNNAGRGILLYAYNTNNNIIKNKANNNAADGISLLANSNNNNTISSNICSKNNGNGIYLAYSSYNTISANECNDNSRGVFLENTANFNVIAQQVSSNNSLSGIIIEDNADNNIISSSVSSGNSAYGVRINTSDVNNTSIMDSTLSGNTAGAILNSGTDTQISGNYTGTAGEGLFHTQANSTSSALTVTQSSTGNIANLVGDAITTGTGMALSADGLTTGTGVDISSTSTVGTGSGASRLLNISRSGINSNASHTAYGLSSSVTNSGTTSTNIGGYFTASGATNNYGLIVASGNVGIGTTAPTSLLNLKGTLTSALTGTVSVTINTAAVTGSGTLFTTELKEGDSIKIGSEIFTVSAIASATSLTLDSNHTAGASGVIAYRDPTLFTIDNGDAVSKFTVLRSGNVGIGIAAPSSVLTLSASGDLAFGDINSNLIDNMDSITDWTASDGTNTPVALESAYIRDGAGAMKITTVAASSNTDYVRKTFSANQDWSSFERIGFWIRGTQAGQIVSIKFYDTGTTTSTHTITIAEANSWQYEEYNISGIASTDRDAVSWAEFYIDDATGNPIFYIDQARVYDYDERGAEMFVDNEGNLVVWGRGGVELGRGVPGSSLSSVKIGSANIEINQPLNVNVAGDTGMAYDLQFLNTGGANITSQGPLVISAGDPNKTQNLTLTTQSNQMSGDSGMATSATGTTLVDSSKAWVTDEWIGGTVYIISGTGYGQERTITDSSGTSITVATWTVNPDTTSAYRLTYQQGGDVIVDVANSSNNIGGFRVAGIDNGSYVFRVGPDGNVEIGGNGTAGSNLVVKQNFSLIGGNITISKLATPTGVAVVPVGTTGATTYGYRISAINNNGQTLASATVSTATGNATLSSTNYNQITWDAVSGATAYKVYGRTASSELYIYTVSAPNLIFNDYGNLTPSGALPTVNTSGGDIAGILSFSDATNLTLSTDAVTVTQTYHTVDEEGTAVDSLSTISGGAAGDVLVLRGFDTDYLVTAKDGVGNLKLSGDFAFTSVNDTLTLLFNGTNWLEVARTTSGADIAESYYTYDLATEAGDLVSVSSSKGEEKPGESRNYFVEKTAGKYNSQMFGIVSTSPFVTMGGGYSKITDESGNVLAETKSVALAGRVPAKVSLENGDIKTGDFLTSSSVAGVAMKAAKAGRVIGRALEPFDGTVTQCEVELIKMENENESAEKENSEAPEKEKQTVRAVNCANIPSEIGKVMTFVQPGWYEGEKATVEWSAEGGTLSGAVSAIKSGMEELGAIIDNGILRIKSIFAEDITAKKLCIEGEDGEKICVEKDQLKDLLNKNQIEPASNSAPAASVPPAPNNIEGSEADVTPAPDVPIETVTPEPNAMP